MDDRFNRKPAGPSTNPPPHSSFSPFLEVPDRFFCRETISPTSDGPSTPSSVRQTPHGSEGEQPPPGKKRRVGNKKAPKTYPSEMQQLIDHGLVIWGQHMNGIEAFEPSAGIRDPLHYSVFQLGSLESRTVTQAQAFSGRDDEVEEWSRGRLASIPRSMLPMSRSGASNPIITQDMRRPFATHPSDETTFPSSYHTDWPWTPPLDYLGQDVMAHFSTLQAARTSPFSAESVGTSVSAEEYDQLSPPPTSSSSYGSSIFASPSTSSATVPVIGRSNYQNAVNFPPAPPAFGYSSAVPHSMGTMNAYALQQAPAVPVNINYANSFSFDSAMAQEGHYQGAETIYDPSAALSGLFPNTPSQTSYDGDMWRFL